jgi:hypothetical protein
MDMMTRLTLKFFLAAAASAAAGDAPVITAHLLGQNYGNVDTNLVVTTEKQKVFHFHSDFAGGGTWYDAFISLEGENVVIVERDSISNPYKGGSKVETSENVYRLPVAKLTADPIALRHGNRINLKATQPTAPRVGGSGAPASPFWGDAVVAMVKEVTDKNATFGNPPRVKLEMVEVLRGDPKLDRTRAVWAPPDHGIDTGVVQENPRYKEWAGTPMRGPKVGEKYVLWGRQVSNEFFTLERWAYTDEARQRALEMIKRDQEAARGRQAKAEAEAVKIPADRAAWRPPITDVDTKATILRAAK